MPLSGKEANTVAVVLAHHLRAGEYDQLQKLANKLTPTELRAALLESVANTVEIAAFTRKAIKQLTAYSVTTQLEQFELYRSLHPEDFPEPATAE
nr:hypothetical protein [Rhodococcus sp. (in: high G+C Gram-positive bacteria)]